MKLQRSFRMTLGLVLAGTLGSSVYAADDTIVVINGQNISQNQFTTFVRAQQAQTPQLNLNDRAVQQEIMQQFINRELLFQDAIARGIDKDPSVAMELDGLRRSALAQANAQRILREHPVTDAQIKQHYDTQIATRKVNEYKTRHILLDSEAAAKAAIARLDKGEDFAKVAKELSKDGTAQRGGEVDWLPPQAMPAAYASAVMITSPNQYTKTPIKSDMGWHVIKVEGSRPMTPPPFDSVRSEIANMLRAQAVNDYLNQLRQKAKIEPKTPPAPAAGGK